MTTQTASKVSYDFPASLQLLNPQFIRYFGVIGIGLLACSFLYLVGANWFMLPDGVKLSFPPALLFLFAFLSVVFENSSKALVDTLQTFAGAMAGLSLAVIGQVYQTGADSVWLFIWWLLLLLPWCYRRNAGIFVLMVVVSHLALALGFFQLAGSEDWGAYIFAASCLAVLQFFWARRCYPILMYLFLVLFAALSFTAAIQNVFMPNKSFSFISIFFAPLAAVWVGKNDGNGNGNGKGDGNSLIFSAGVGILGFSLFLWIAFLAKIYSLFFWGIIGLAWFALLGSWVRKLFPDSMFHVIPLAIGGWLTGSLLSTAILIDFYSGASFVGILFFGLGAFLLFSKSESAFLRHLGYMLFIAGQMTSYFWITKQFIGATFLVLVLLQSIVVIALLFMRAHWFFLLGQCFALYEFIYAWTLQISSIDAFLDVLSRGEVKGEGGFCFVILQLIGVLPLLLLPVLRFSGWFRLAAFFVLFSMLGWSLGSYYFDFLAGFSSRFVGDVGFYFYIPWLAVLLGLWGYMLRDVLRGLLPILVFLGMAAVSLVLGYFGYANVFFVLMVLALSIARKDRLVQVFSCVILVFLLWHLYYSLSVLFLFKFVSIFVSSALVIGLAFLMKRASADFEQLSFVNARG